MASRKEYELAVKIAGMVDASLSSSCNLTKRQLKEIAREAAAANAKTVSTSDALKKAGPGIDAAWDGLKTTVTAAAAAVAAGAAAVTGVGKASIDVGKEFETAMSSWKATADANEEEFNRAREAALQMGRTTSKTAKDSANALEYMALAGWSVDDSIKGLPSVLRLSEATEMDLARASDLVTDSMSALGVQVDDLEGYLNIVAKANNKSNQTAEQLMEAYLGVGGTMKNLHVPLEESATALGVMANRGIKASEGGNAMNAVMINLTTGAGQAGKKMKELGISAFDSNGKFKGLKETLATVDKAVSSLTEKERNAALSMIGGKQHVDALNALLSGLNTTVADGKSEWDSLNESLEHADGALEKMAQTKMDNLDGDLAILESALQDAGIQIYDGLTDPLREGTQFATDMVYKFAGTIATNLKETMPTAKRELKQAGESFEEFARPILNIGEWTLSHPDVIGGGVAAAATTITATKAAQTFITTAQAAKTLGVAMASNPVTATIGAASLAAGAIAGIAVQAKIADERLKKNNLSEHFGNMSLTLGELDDVATRIIDNGKFSQLSTAMEELDKVKTIADDIKKSHNTLEKLNWKVQMGFELGENEYSSYKMSIDQYVEDSLKLAEQQQYAMSLNLNVLLGDGDDGATIKEKFNSFYGEMYDELQELGKQLGDYYAEGIKDGVLSMDEVQVIQGLQNQMAEITQKMATNKFAASMETIKMKYEDIKLDEASFQNLQDEIQTKVKEMSQSLEDSLQMNIAGLEWQLSEKKISEKEFDDTLTEFKESYRKQIAELQAQAGAYMSETIMTSYADEVAAATPQITEAIDEAMETAFADMGKDDRLTEMYGTYFSEILEAGITASNTEGLSEGSRLAIEQLLKNMAPTIEQMEEAKKKAKEAGEEVPKALADALKDVKMLELVVGSADAIWSYTGAGIESSPEYKATYDKVKDLGGTLPTSLAEGMVDRRKEIDAGVDELFRHMQDYVATKFADPINVKANLRVVGAGEWIAPYAAPQKHADGGIFDEPHFGVLAEAGPEAYVPLDGTKRSISIWQQAGAALGVMSGTTSQDDNRQNIVYSPTYQIYGADEHTVRSATKDDQERFETMMNRYMKDQKRLAF